MLDNFYQWLLNEKVALKDKGIIVEEIEYRINCELPFIKVIVNSRHFMGQICLWKNRLMDLEILNSYDFTIGSNLDFYEHYEFDRDVDWGSVLNKNAINEFNPTGLISEAPNDEYNSELRKIAVKISITIQQAGYIIGRALLYT